MASLSEAQDAYDRHNIHVGVIYSDVADVILKLEAELAAAQIGLADEQELRARSEMIVLAARRLKIAVETLNGIDQAETVLWAAIKADDAKKEQGATG